MRNVFVLLFIILLLISCKKKEYPVIVKGQAWDDSRQKPVKNLLIYIYDVKCENFGCHFNQILDSTRTDESGHYEMIYQPQNGNSLHIDCSYQPRTYVYADPEQRQRRLSIGNNTGDFILRKTTVLKARIIMSNNPFPPLKIIDNIEAFMVEVNGINKDTVVYLRGVANKNNFIDFLIIEPGYIYYKRKTENIVVNSLVDTFAVTILTDPSTYPQFKY
jgi:hypothetical protein